MKNKIIYTSDMFNYNYIYKFENVGDTASGLYVGIIHSRGKYPQDYILLRQNNDTVLVKLHAQIQDMIGVILRGDYVRIKLEDIIQKVDNHDQKFYKFKIQISIPEVEDAKNEEAPF